MSKRNWPDSYAHPRFWPAWRAIGAMRVGAWLPWRLRLAIGRGLGLLAWAAVPRRRHIVDTNLRLCFPQLGDAERAKLVRETFEANGIGILETATGWCRDPRHLRHRVTYKGRHHLEAAYAQGKGVLVVGIHFSTLDLGGSLVIERCPPDLKHGLDVFPEVSEPAFALMRRVKEQFDPKGVLSPGRHVRRL